MCGFLFANLFDYWLIFMNTVEIDIFKAIYQKDATGLQKLIGGLKDIDFHLSPESITEKLAYLRDFVYQTPLYMATKTNQVELVKVLLNGGSDIDMLSSDKDTLFASPYNYVVLNGNEELMSIFAEYAENKSVASISTKNRSKNVSTTDYRKKRKSKEKD